MSIRTVKAIRWSAAILAGLCLVPVAHAQAPADTSAVPVAPAITAVPVDPPRSESEFRNASARYSPVVRGCYEREGLRADPGLSATVEVGVTVEPGGSVREITVDTLAVTGVGIANVARCVSQAATTWKFQAGPYAEERAILTFKLLAPRSASTH